MPNLEDNGIIIVVWKVRNHH